MNTQTATELRVLSSIVAAVPVRLMKRDLLFITENLLPLLDERRLQTLARSRGIRPQDGDAIGKLMVAFARKADESALGRLIVEGIILLSARNQPDAGKVLKNAALTYKVDTDAIALKVKQEFAVKDNPIETAYLITASSSTACLAMSRDTSRKGSVGIEELSKAYIQICAFIRQRTLNI